MEDLDEPIYFRNADWAVTGYGIERTDGSYPIEAKRLGELANYTDQKLPDWPLHIARKVWNFDLFMEAFMIALWVHRGEYDPAFLANKDWVRDCKAVIEKKRRNREGQVSISPPLQLLALTHLGGHYVGSLQNHPRDALGPDAK
jgi:hypothetical protein